MLNLERDLYNKPLQNDNSLEFAYLHDKNNYKVLGQKYRPFYLKPLYARRKDFERFVGFRRSCFRIFGGLALLRLGYEVGRIDAKDVDLEKS